MSAKIYRAKELTPQQRERLDRIISRMNASVARKREKADKERLRYARAIRRMHLEDRIG